MTTIPSNRAQLIALLRQAIEADQGPDGPIDDEHLILLATGRGDRLSDEQRRSLLRQVAANPEAARLVRELHELGLDEGQDAPDVSPPVVFTFRRVAQVGWAVAACLFIAIGAWRMADPPAPLNLDGTIRPYQTDDRIDYWEQLDRQRLIERAEHDHLRDIALVISASACLVLAIPVAWWLLRSGPRRQDT